MAVLPDSVKSALSDERMHYIMWGVAFVGVCVLVAVGKLKPETVEYLLFALLGKASSLKPKKEEE